jgi:hypothetical protein
MKMFQSKRILRDIIWVTLFKKSIPMMIKKKEI